MKFWDKVKVKVIAGDGGNGCNSWRREKYIAYGGPDGGDGWKGGDIYFEWDSGQSSLIDLYYKKQIKAKRWEHWKGSDQYGESADDVIVKVPLGTIVKNKNTGEILWTILEHWQRLLVAKWWRGGWWNIHFKNAVKQYPDFAMFGEPGEQLEIEAELQLIWDVTLIGFPSVGKSSIINTLSNAKAKVAEYSFTTLVPNLGVVKHKERNFVLVDVPWLIEWAGSWKGLWNEFLRHILKSKIWTFVLDASRYEESCKEVETLKQELEKYIKTKLLTDEELNILSKLEWVENIDEENIKITYEQVDNVILMKVYLDWKLLFSKFLIFVLNKIDLVQDEEILEELKQELIKKINSIFLNSEKWLKEKDLFCVYAWNKNIFDDYLNTVVNLLKKNLEQDTIFDEYLQPKKEYIKEEKRLEPYVRDITDQELDYLVEEWYIEEEKAQNLKVFEVWNKKLAYYTYILPWWNKEAEMLFFDVMKSEWITSWLEKNWVMIGDILKIKSPYQGKEDRYIEWKL
jgi:GTP-binding protein